MFFKGKATGQQHAWLEANLVFVVARLLARVDVPAFIVHDEAIVPVDMVKAVHGVRYTTGLRGFGELKGRGSDSKKKPLCKVSDKLIH